MILYCLDMISVSEDEEARDGYGFITSAKRRDVPSEERIEWRITMNDKED